MISKTELIAYAEEVGRWLDAYVAPTIDYLQANKTAVKIEQSLPHGITVIKAIGGLAAIEKMVAGAIPEVGQVYAMYEVYKALGGKPASQEDFDRQEASRGSQE